MLHKILYHIRQHFGLSRTQTYGTTVLLLLLVTSLIATTLLQYHQIQHQKHLILNNHTHLNTLTKQLQQNNPSYHNTNNTTQQPYLNINTATQKDLKQLYGIGNIRAKRIITYRNNLGGFINKHQYTEIYNLPPDLIHTLQQHTYIAPNFIPKKINLNTTPQHLAKHPYITYNQAKALCAYIQQHNTPHTLQHLKKIKCLPSRTLKKLIPYLQLNN